MEILRNQNNIGNSMVSKKKKVMMQPTALKA